MKLKFSLLTSVALLTIPAFAFAQNIGTVQNLFSFALNILNGYVVPLVFAVAFLMFLIGIYRYYIAGGADEEKVKEGNRFLMWSMAGFFVMFSVWGLINLFLNTLGFNSSAMPAIPTFSNSSISTGSSLTNGIGSIISGLLSGSGSGSSSYSTGTAFNANGTTLVNGVSMPNVVAAGAGGTCPSGYTLSGSSCINNAAAGASSVINGLNGSNPTSGAGAGNQDVPLNGACQHSDDCTGNYICVSGTCSVQPSDVSSWGQTQSGGQCTYDEQCVGGFKCSPTSHTCVAADDGTSGQQNGDVGAGGACERSSDCQGDLECDQTHGTCVSKSEDTTAAGSVPVGGNCAFDEACEGDNVFCDNNVCTIDPGTQNADGSPQMQDCSDGTQVPVGQTCPTDTIMCDGDPAPAGSTCCTGGGYAQPGSSCPTPTDTSGTGTGAD